MLTNFPLNFIKTNYMIIESTRKTSGSIEVKLQNIEGPSYLLERKDHIKYLGVITSLSAAPYRGGEVCIPS